ncbi:Uncharacterized protein FWK35_00036995 [Aphis craccivora]|uniref:SAM domain-containing protein n=1 Tax=Aphis craccivora TaxID=307492 RepID=A0A6G0VX92_APHCR|nr:Uncharacterized protein FWK35_00036995 [Aphis craccivora]
MLSLVIMKDSDVVDMLTAWGLSNYIDVFKEQDIDVFSLSLLTEDMIKEIIPMVGHRAKFKGNLKEWKKSINCNK